MQGNIQTQKDVVRYAPDLVGLSFTTPHYAQAMNLAEYFRRTLNPTLVAGGAHPTAVNPEELLGVFDTVVQGEGEVAFSKILNGEEREVFKEPYVSDVDALPQPAWDMIDMERYNMDWDGNRATTLFSSRGCPYNCSFCSKDVWGRVLRQHSPKRVVDEMDYLFKNYGIGHFYFYDDTFTADKRRVRGIVDEIFDREAEDVYRWKIITRADTVDQELLHYMHDGGCREVSFGIEHADDDSLGILNKGMTVGDNVRAVTQAKNAGMKVKGFFIIGLPYDSPMKIVDTVNLAKDLDLDHALFSVMMPYPGTNMYRYPERYGIELDKSIRYGDWLQYAGYNTANCYGH